MKNFAFACVAVAVTFVGTSAFAYDNYHYQGSAGPNYFGASRNSVLPVWNNGRSSWSQYDNYRYNDRYQNYDSCSPNHHRRFDDFGSYSNRSNRYGYGSGYRNHNSYGHNSFGLGRSNSFGW